MILALVISGFALSLFAPWIHKVGRSAAGWILALLPLALTIYFASLFSRMEKPIQEIYAWVPDMDIQLSFYADGLGLLFALIICGVGTLVVIYTGGYLSGNRFQGRFFAYVLAFMGSMLGVVLSDNLIALFVFWELTSITSYFLIGFDHQREEARTAALQALLVTGAGGLVMMAGLLMLGHAGGSMELSVLLTRGEEIRAHGLYLPILILILIGVCTKSAQFPFHFWLPNAMEAPTPASAYLHAATMVKAGIYILARFSPVLGGTDAWLYIVSAIGCTTMVTGAYLAVLQTYLKRLLAYTTVSALGVLVMLLGLGNGIAVQAAMAFLLAHSFYKGALFLVAGIIDHETGERDVERLNGLRKAMPITAVAAGVAALSMAGLPPLFGFIGKEMVYEAALGAPWVAGLFAAAGVLSSMGFVAVAGLVGIKPFWGAIADTPKHPHEAPSSLYLGPAVLAALGLMFGLMPRLGGEQLISASASAVLGYSAPVHLGLWHGLNLALLLSAITLIGGMLVYRIRSGLRSAAQKGGGLAQLGPARGYFLGLRALNWTAYTQTRVLQNGYLRYYLLAIIAAAIGLIGYAILYKTGIQVLPPLSEIRYYEAGVAVIILLGAVAVIRSTSSLGAVVAIGVVGYGVAVIFVLFRAPDLVMTQFTIETLTVILFALVFYHLPPLAHLSSPFARARDLVASIAVGGLITVLMLMVIGHRTHPSISAYFAENSLLLAQGRNIVNVILVDFRGVDTLGEITVLAIAGVGVYSLLKLRAEEKGNP